MYGSKNVWRVSSLSILDWMRAKEAEDPRLHTKLADMHGTCQEARAGRLSALSTGISLCRWQNHLPRKQCCHTWLGCRCERWAICLRWSECPWGMFEVKWMPMKHVWGEANECPWSMFEVKRMEETVPVIKIWTDRQIDSNYVAFAIHLWPLTMNLMSWG